MPNLDENDLSQLPPALRNKISQLDPSAIERIRDRVRRRMTRMTAKKWGKLQREKERKAQEIMRKSPPVESWQETAYPGPNSPLLDSPPNPTRFAPKPGDELVDIPLVLKEGVRKELIEKHGVPEPEAEVIAGNAIDNWVKVVPPPEPTPTAEAQAIEKSFQPEFLIHPFSPVEYPEGEFGSTFGQYGDEGAPTGAPLIPAVTPEDVEIAKAEAGAQNYQWLWPVAIGAGLLIFAARRK